MAGIPGMGGQRQAVRPGADNGHLVVGGIHLGLHGRQGVKPAVVAGLLPGQPLHRLHHRQRGKFRQNLCAGKKLFPPGILLQNGRLKRMHHQHFFARQCRTPGLGMVVGFQRPQLGEKRAPTFPDDLPFGAHIPQGQQIGIVNAVHIILAEADQGGVVGGEHPGQVLDILAGTVGKMSAVFQPVGHGAHLGSAAAAEHKGFPPQDGRPGQFIACFGLQHLHAAVFDAEPQPFIQVACRFYQRVIVVHGQPPVF